MSMYRHVRSVIAAAHQLRRQVRRLVGVGIRELLDVGPPGAPETLVTPPSAFDRGHKNITGLEPLLGSRAVHSPSEMSQQVRYKPLFVWIKCVLLCHIKVAARPIHFSTRIGDIK